MSDRPLFRTPIRQETMNSQPVPVSKSECEENGWSVRDLMKIILDDFTFLGYHDDSKNNAPGK